MTKEEINILSERLESALKPYVREIVKQEMSRVRSLIEEEVGNITRETVRDTIQGVVSESLIVRIEVKR